MKRGLGTLQEKTCTREHLSSAYPKNKWTRVYKDGSAKNTITNRGVDIYIEFPSWHILQKAVLARLVSAN